MTQSSVTREKLASGMDAYLLAEGARLRELEASKTDEARARARFAAALRDRGNKTPAFSRKLAFAVPVLAAAATLAFWLRPTATPRPTDFWVIRNAEEAQGTAASSLLANATLRFSNGVMLRLGNDASGHVRFDSMARAELHLARGRATFLATGDSRNTSASTAFAIVVGDYRVETDAQRIRAGDYVEWTPENQSLSHAYFERGAIVRDGRGTPRALPTGVEFEFDFAGAAPQPVPEPTPTPTAAPESTAQDQTPALPIASTRAAHLPDAVGRDVDATFAEVLAARAAHLPQRARSLLLQIRRQLPRTPAAARAAFELGRIAEGAESARWLTLYLSEAEFGEYRREAMGRLLHQSSDRQQWAERYLHDFPEGPEAAFARAQLVND